MTDTEIDLSDKKSTMKYRFLRHRDGYFGDTYIDGIWLEYKSCARAWVVSVGLHGVDQSFHVSGEEFRTVGGKAVLNDGTMLVGDVVSEIDSETRQTILKALKMWEIEPRKIYQAPTYNPAVDHSNCIRLG
jgi:hypothetical protein